MTAGALTRSVAFLATLSLIAACGPGTTAPLPSDPAAGTASPTAATASGGALGERRNDGGGIEVVAAWSSIDPPSLKIAVDTHSVDLDRFDLAALAKLRLDGGQWTAPTAAELPRGGHHRAGTLTFGAVPPAAFGSARLIELRIIDVGVPERLLRWERTQ